MRRALRAAWRLATLAFCALLLCIAATTAHTLWSAHGTGLSAQYWRYLSLWDRRKPLEQGGLHTEPGARLIYRDLYHVRSLFQRCDLEFNAASVQGVAVQIFGARTRTLYRFAVPDDVASGLAAGVHTLSLDTDGQRLGLMLDGRFVRRVESRDDYFENLEIELGPNEIELLHFRVFNTQADTLSEQTDFHPRRVRVLGRAPVYGAVILAGLLCLLLDAALVGRITVRPWGRVAAFWPLHYLPLLLGLVLLGRHPGEPILLLTGLGLSLFLRARHAILARGLFSVRDRLIDGRDVWRRRVSGRGMARWSFVALLCGALLDLTLLPFGLDAPELLAAWAALVWAGCLAYGTLLGLLGRLGGPELVRRQLWTFAPLALSLPWIAGEPPRSLAGPLLLCVLLLQFTFLTANRGRLRGYGLLMSLWLLTLLAGVEGWMRLDPRLARWEQPMGLGTTYAPDDSLFYIPKSLFVRREDFQMRDDFKVYNQVNFRSGAIPFDKPADQFRIFVLGGSNVYGDGIEQLDDVFTEALERRLNSHGAARRFEVVNAGVRGYNSFQLMILDREYLARYQTDLAILYLNRNDLIHDEGPYTYRELYAMLHRPGGAAWVPRAQSLLRRSYAYNYYTDLLVRGRMWFVNHHSPAARISKNVNPPEDYAQNLRELIGQLRSRRVQVLLASEYWGEAAARNMDLKGDIPEQRELMERVSREQGVAFVDVYGILRRDYEVAQIVFSNDLVHCNQAGHQAIAEVLERTLISERLVPIAP